MKATTIKILTALAEARVHGSVGLPLDPEIYPPASRATAAEAFSGLCRLRQLPGGAMRVSVIDPAEDGRRVIGEFLNFALVHALKQQLGSEETE